MATQQSASVTLDVSVARVRAALLDPGAYPDWNPAFRAVDADGPGMVGPPYRLSVRPGLNGHFQYTAIEMGHIVTRWEVPGFTEVGTWTLVQHGTRTSLDHRFTHSGPLAAALAPAYRGVAGLRLERLGAYLDGLHNQEGSAA